MKPEVDWPQTMLDLSHVALDLSQVALDLSHAESALINFLREGEALHHQIIISCLEQSWCIERVDLSTSKPPAVGYGDSFAEAWSRVAGRVAH
jgi:hypothetical protein